MKDKSIVKTEVKQLIKIGESKMFDFVSVNVLTGKTFIKLNDLELQKKSIKNGASGSPHGILLKPESLQFCDFIKNYKSFDRATKLAVDSWAKDDLDEFNKCLNY